MVSAVGEGLLSGIGGALMGAEGYIQEERKQKNAMSLADYQHEKQLELEQLKQQYKQTNDATAQGYEAGLLELQSTQRTNEKKAEFDRENSPAGLEAFEKKEKIKAKYDTSKDPSWLTVTKGEQRVKDNGQAVLSDLASKIANSTNPGISKLGQEMSKAQDIDELKVFAGEYKRRFEYAQKKGEDVTGLIPPKLWNDYVTDLDDLLDTLEREVAQNGGIREDMILDRIDQLHKNPEYAALFAEVPEEDDFKTKRDAAAAAIAEMQARQK